MEDQASSGNAGQAALAPDSLQAVLPGAASRTSYLVKRSGEGAAPRANRRESLCSSTTSERMGDTADGEMVADFVCALSTTRAGQAASTCMSGRSSKTQGPCNLVYSTRGPDVDATAWRRNAERGRWMEIAGAGSARGRGWEGGSGGGRRGGDRR
ncbi:uncharacterized protein [Aegilops tauschii subsp. strangulata]|uniref:uncharacterized protein isoform X2 n=1 Tax=Aegilops tauschii subsp. strangulata TaxID=200361 RepID=UPI003CC8CB0D